MKLRSAIGFLKSLFKCRLSNTLRVLRHRISGVRIQSGANIASGVKLNVTHQVGRGTTLGSSVKLGEGVSIGSMAVLDNINIGSHSAVESNVICTGCGDGMIVIGKESYIGISNVLDFSDSITIGNFVHIAGPSTGLWTHSSAGMCMNSIPLDQKDELHRPTAQITIEDNVYIGGNCTIYPGIRIGHHSIVAPNSVVTKDVQPYTMVGGVPAMLIKKVA